MNEPAPRDDADVGDPQPPTGNRQGDGEPPVGSEVRGAGRGGIAIAGAKVWFIMVGVVQQIALPRIIGLEGYGAYSIVQGISNIPNNVVTTSSIQGVSRAVAEATGHEAEGQRRALRIHAALAPGLAALFFVFAPVAASFEHAPHIVRPLRIFSLILFVYALYTPLVGALNGNRRFVAQAGLDVTFATLRTFGLLGGAYLLGRYIDGVTGAAIGLAVAAAAILPFALMVAGIGRTGPGGPSVSKHLLTLFPIAVGQFFLNALMQADLQLLRRFAHESGEAAGFTGAFLRSRTDSLVAAYKAAQLFAFLPYQLLLSITFILFPMLARAHAQHENDRVAQYVSTGVRLALILGGLMVSVTSGLAPILLRFAYVQQAADDGGTALRVLALGQGAFAVFGIETTVLVSLSRERSSAVLTALASLLVGALCWWLVPSASFDRSLLLRTAMATSMALGLAAVAGATLVRRASGSFAPPKTLIRTSVAVAVAIALGMAMRWWGHAFVLIQAVIVVAAFLAVAVALGEITRKDLAMIRAVLGKSDR